MSGTSSTTHLTHRTFPDVDFSAIRLDGIRQGKNGMKFASLVGPRGQRLVFESPAMKLPWSTEIRRNEESGQFSAKIALSFQGMSDDEADDGKLRRFFVFLNRMDERVKQLALQHKGDLWQKTMDAGKIDAVFQSSVKAATNDKYPPTFQGKIPLQEGSNPSSDDVNEAMEMKIVVFRKDKTKVSPSELKGGCLASVIAEASYVWVTPMMIGIAWVVKFVLVEPKPRDDVFQFTDTEEFADVEDGAGASPGDKRKREEGEEEKEDGVGAVEEGFHESDDEFS